MADFTTRMALWSMQGQRHCQICEAKVYTSVNPGGGESLEHVFPDYNQHVGGHMVVARV